MYQLRAITEPLVIGEGPHWDHNQQALLFVDLIDNTIHKYVPATERHTKTIFVPQAYSCDDRMWPTTLSYIYEKQNRSPSRNTTTMLIGKGPMRTYIFFAEGGANFIIPVEGTSSQFVVGAGHSFLIIQWDGEDESAVEMVRELGKVDQNRPQNRINDGKADPRGRLFAGTMNWPENLNAIEYEKGSLYFITPVPNGEIFIENVADKITLSNGLAWDLKEKAFYYIDSLEYKIRRYDYNELTGSIANQKYIFDLRIHDIEGIPDGMTIDTNGNLWIAVFGGSCVLKIDPRTGKLLQKIPIPAKQVTSVTFGGPNYDVLYVTTASVTLGEEVQPPPCGSTYMITGLGVKGYPNINFKI